MTLGGADDLFTGQNGVDNADGGSANDRLNGARRRRPAARRGRRTRRGPAAQGPDQRRSRHRPGRGQHRRRHPQRWRRRPGHRQQLGRRDRRRRRRRPSVVRAAHPRRHRPPGLGLANDGQSGEGDDVRQVENLTGTPFADTLRAPFDTTQFPANIRGNGGRDVVVGGIGDDELRGRTVDGDPMKGAQGGDDDIFATRMRARPRRRPTTSAAAPGSSSCSATRATTSSTRSAASTPSPAARARTTIRAADDTRDLISCDRLAPGDTGTPGTADSVSARLGRPAPRPRRLRDRQPGLRVRGPRSPDAVPALAAGAALACVRRGWY